MVRKPYGNNIIRQPLGCNNCCGGIMPIHISLGHSSEMASELPDIHMVLEHIQRLEHEKSCLRTEQEITAVEQLMRDLVMQSSHKKASPTVELHNPLHKDSEVRAPNLGSIREGIHRGTM